VRIRDLPLPVIIINLAAMLTGGCSSNAVAAAGLFNTPTQDLSPITATLPATNTGTPVPPTLTATSAITLENTIVSPSATTTQGAISGQKQPLQDGTPVPTDEEGLPVSHYVYGVLGHKQYFKLGCEAAATHDWSWFFGVSINEFEFQNKLPLSDNPEVGFVGSVNSKWGQAPPYAYGVHAAPVARLLQEYGMPATAVKGYTLTQLKQQIAADRPVIVWVIGNVVGGIPWEYTAKDGSKVIVAAYEHVVIVTGYNETHIRYLNNEKYYEAPIEVFLNSWKVLGNMALIAGN
jgi:uncharacterized protein YvpB